MPENFTKQKKRICLIIALTSFMLTWGGGGGQKEITHETAIPSRHWLNKQIGHIGNPKIRQKFAFMAAQSSLLETRIDPHKKIITSPRKVCQYSEVRQVCMCISYTKPAQMSKCIP